VIVTHVVEQYEETVAAYERLGFERLLKGTARGTLFRAGPALVEVVDGTQQRAAGRHLTVSARSVSRTRT
jgi:hypothetical protein